MEFWDGGPGQMLGGAFGGLAVSNPQMMSQMQNVAQANMYAALGARQATQQEMNEYARLMMNANPTIQMPYVQPMRVWPQSVDDAIRDVARADWIYWGWVAALAGLALIRFGVGLLP